MAAPFTTRHNGLRARIGGCRTSPTQQPRTKRFVDRREFKNEREEWEKFVEGIPRDSKVAIEACSYWYPVCDFLEERGIEMVLSHPSKTRIIAEAKIKTDKVDSKNLAKLLRADFLPQSYIPSKEIRDCEAF
ncbi:hypothetical protein CW713_04920 [Methanophagales archaeon]|nr:MAG: hypothetical protein CW713_04920 [Methanophagales archaeon]